MSQQDSHSSDTVHFFCKYWFRLSGISVAVLIPCFWQSRIEAGDLGSHVYNVWLAQGIARNQVPGLVIVPQWSNVLFDCALNGFASLFGLETSEKIVVGLSVLLFFWGAFAWICATGRRTPWFLLPVLATLAYGWTFTIGFFNFYLSLGLSWIALALFCRGGLSRKGIALLLTPLILLAHYLGLAMFLAILLYRWISERLPLRKQPFVLLLGIIFIACLRLYVAHNYPVVWPKLPAYLRTGADQFMLFDNHYLVLALLMQFFVLAILAIEMAIQRRDVEFWKQISLPLQGYILIESAAWLLPEGVMVSAYGRPADYLVSRITIVSAICALCMLGAVTPRLWHGVGLGILATIFFLFLWNDVSRLNRLETDVARLVRTIPAGSRVTTTYWRLPDSRIMLQHIVDRACIGHCYAYSNYEPSSRQFRVRAARTNPFVQADPALTGLMESGKYVVQPQDTPMFQVFLCGSSPLQACLRELPAGSATGY